MDPTRSDPDEGTPATVRQRFDGPTSVAIVKAVAESLGCSPLDLPSLADAGLDPEALDALFSREFGPPPSIEFVYAGQQVTVVEWCVYVQPT